MVLHRFYTEQINQFPTKTERINAFPTDWWRSEIAGTIGVLMPIKLKELPLIYSGKTKDVYLYDETSILLHTKDSVTGWKIKNNDGTYSVVIDPGANEVIGEVSGIGKKNIISSIYYFNKFTEANIHHHFLDADINESTMRVKKANKLGAGLECIVRFYALGSILRTYPDYVKYKQPLTDYFEITTKNDEAGDPRISKEFLTNPDFGPIITEVQYENARQLSLNAAKLIRDDLSQKGYTLIDIKFEIGVFENQIIIIDEISAGIMRVFKDETQLSETELADLLVDFYNRIGDLRSPHFIRNG